MDEVGYVVGIPDNLEVASTFAPQGSKADSESWGMTCEGEPFSSGPYEFSLYEKSELHHPNKLLQVL